MSLDGPDVAVGAQVLGSRITASPISKAEISGSEISQSECHRLLAGSESGRLGVVVAGRPEIFVLRYALDVSEAVVFQTEPGTKLAGALGHRAVFEVDDIEQGVAGWCVVVHGIAQQTALTSLQFGGRGTPPWMGPGSITARITATSVTGRILAAS